MTFLWLKPNTAEHCGSFSTDFHALYIRVLFQWLHLYFANKHDGNRVSLSGKHVSMKILLCHRGSDLFIFYMAPRYLPFPLSWQSLIEQRLHEPSGADPAPQVVVPHLLSRGQSCKTSSHTSIARTPHILCGKAFLGSDHAFASSHACISSWCSRVCIKTPLLPQVHGSGGSWGAEVTGLVWADEGSCNQKYE